MTDTIKEIIEEKDRNPNSFLWVCSRENLAVLWYDEDDSLKQDGTEALQVWDLAEAEVFQAVIESDEWQ